MSFSWMKATTLGTRVLVTTLAFSVAFAGSFPTAQADDRTARKKTVSYAEELSEVRETIDTTESEIERVEQELADAEKDKKIFANWDRLVENDDPVVNDYSPENCNCGPANGCNLGDLLSGGVLDAGDVVSILPPGCGKGGGGKGGRQTQDDPKAKSSPRPGGDDFEYGAQDGTGDADGTGGGTGKPGKGGKGCEPKLFPKHAARVCKKIYDQGGAKWDPYGESGSVHVSSTCRNAARECGPVKKDIRAGRINQEIKELRAELERLKKLLKTKIARRKLLESEKGPCPECRVMLDEVAGGGKPTVGDYIIGGLNAVSPMVVAGIGAGMYNRYLKTSLNAYNGYLNNSLAGCQAYYAQGVTLGVPSNPCSTGMWAGGIASAPGYGGFGVGMMGMGMPGIGMGIGMGYPGMGMAMGMPGMGMMGMGFPGAIGTMIGSAMGGAFGYPGGFGGMGYVASFGQPGFGSGFGVGMGYPSQIGSPGFNMSFGYGMPGMGYPGYGMPGFGGYGVGGSFAGFSAGTFGTGFGSFQGFQGGYTGIGGMYMGGMGMDQLYMARMQMQGQNAQLAQQQYLEQQQRYMQVSSSYGMGAGMGMMGMGGYGYGMPGIGGYGYGVGVPTSIGSAIGTLFGFGGYGYGASYTGLPY